MSYIIIKLPNNSIKAHIAKFFVDVACRNSGITRQVVCTGGYMTSSDIKQRVLADFIRSAEILSSSMIVVVDSASQYHLVFPSSGLHKFRIHLDGSSITLQYAEKKYPLIYACSKASSIATAIFKPFQTLVVYPDIASAYKFIDEICGPYISVQGAEDKKAENRVKPKSG